MCLYSTREGYTSLVETILGQSVAIESLLQSARGPRRHHAWIFSGPFGVGKYTTAIKFAELILQTKLGSDALVGSCRDVHVIRKEDVAWSQNPVLQRKKQTNIPLDLLRERMIGGHTSDGKHHDSIAFKTPIVGSEKVFIIDEAELLDEAGQNALLKTLEEPPGSTTIILVTCREDLLLPTIRSRCQTVVFLPLDGVAMERWSKQGCSDMDRGDLSWAIMFSCGSPGLVCEAIESKLPQLARSLAPFLSLEEPKDYATASERLLLFVESNVARWTKDNTNTSKEAANRRAMNLLLLLFGMSSRQLVRGSHPRVGVSAAGVLVNIEQQLKTNISIKVLVESLAARWAHLCVGDAVFM